MRGYGGGTRRDVMHLTTGAEFAAILRAKYEELVRRSYA
jgi:hypothetical protein